jgi:integrase
VKTIIDWEMNIMIATAQPTVVQEIGINYIADYYNAFLAKFPEGTSKNYRTDLGIYFDVVFGKSEKFVTIEDLKNTKMLDAMKFYTYLTEEVDKKKQGKIIREPRYKNNSVNRKVNAVKSFLRFMNADYNEINDNIFKGVKSLNPDLDSEGYDGLDWMEAIDIWEYAQEHYDEQLAMLFKLASVTSIRLDALLNATWENNWFSKFENGVNVDYIEVIDKGKKHKKPVSEAFYSELQKKLGCVGRLFPNLYDKKVGKQLGEIVTALGFDPRRNIKFHSFKKAGVMRALQLTGNMYKAKEQGNHSSINTAGKYYLKYKECLSDMISYSIDEEIDVENEITEYSKEELVSAILKMSEGSQIELMKILKGN